MSSSTTRGYPFPQVGDKIRDFVTTAKALADKLEADIKAIKSGTDTVTGLSTGTPVTKTITFAAPFPVGVVPHVIVQARGTSNPQNFDVAPSSEDKDGFVVAVTRRAGANTSVPVVYIARG